MKLKRFVDTNVFVEIFGRNTVKTKECVQLLKEKRGLYTSELVVAEVEWVLRSFYKMRRSDIVRCLKKMLSMSNLEIERDGALLKALTVYETEKADWIDCVNAVKMRKKKMRVVYGYDKHFDKFGWLKRVEP